jgi:hypothetical protein
VVSGLTMRHFYSCMFERIKDRWITWRTGKTKAVRDYVAWYDENIDIRQARIKFMFKKFRHVIIVDPNKFFNLREPFGWVLVNDAKTYFWPERPLAENCVWRWERVEWNRWEQDWYINEFSGADKVFVATNSDQDAIMLTLKYS